MNKLKPAFAAWQGERGLGSRQALPRRLLSCPSPSLFPRLFCPWTPGDHHVDKALLSGGSAATLQPAAKQERPAGCGQALAQPDQHFPSLRHPSPQTFLPEPVAQAPLKMGGEGVHRSRAEESGDTGCMPLTPSQPSRISVERVESQPNLSGKRAADGHKSNLCNSGLCACRANLDGRQSAMSLPWTELLFLTNNSYNAVLR